MDCKRKGSTLAQFMVSNPTPLTSPKAPALQPRSALPRLNNVQALRGIGVIMVILAHMMAIEYRYSPDQIMGDWWEYMGVAIDVFFIISGFIMVYVTRALPRSLREGSKFLFGRASRVYPIYWVVSLALLAVYLVRPDMVFSSIEEPSNLLKSFALWPESRPPLLAVGWTLIYEVFFYTIFAISFLLARKWLPLFLILWLGLCFAGYQAGLAVYGTAAGILFSPFTMEILLGSLCALCVEWLHPRLSPKGQLTSARISAVLVALSIAFISVTIYKLIAQDLDIMLDFGRRAALFALPCAIIVTGTIQMDLAGWSFPKFLSVIGEWSYSIYLTHILTLAVMGRIWARLSQEGLWDNALWLPALMLGSIIGGGLVYRFAEQPLLTLSKKLRRRLFDAPRL